MHLDSSDINLVLITAPAIEAVPTVDLQTQSTLAGTAPQDPAFLERLLASAREQLENQTQLQLITATYELRLPWFPYGRIELPKAPLQDVLSIKYVDTDGVLQTLSDSEASPPVTSAIYETDYKSPHCPTFGEVYPAYDQEWPQARREKNSVRIRFTAGFGDAPTDIPPGIRHWILMMAATMNEHREREITGAIISEFKFIEGLLDPWRVKTAVR